MKYGSGNFMIIAALALSAGSASSQVPDVPSALPMTDPPVTDQPSGQISAPSPVNMITIKPGAAPSPGAASATPAPGGTPAPTAVEVMTWSTKALADEVALSARNPETKPKRKKGAALPESKIAELRTRIARDEKDIKTRLKLAEHYEAEQQPGKMVELLRPVAADLSRKGLLLLARAYQLQKDYKEEIRVLEILRARKEKDYHVQYSLGVAYSNFGDRASAIDRLEESRRLNGRYYPAYEALLRETKRDSRWNDALSIAQDTVGKFGGKAKYMGELCLLYAFNGYLEKADEVCRTALSKDPRNPRTHVVLALVVKDKDGLDASERILKKAAHQFPSSELAQWAAAELYWEKKNQFAALKHYRAAVKAEPDSARSQIGLARAAFEEKRYEEALRAFVRACVLNRVYVQDLRKSASALRRAANSEWSSKYDGAIGKCGIL